VYDKNYRVYCYEIEIETGSILSMRALLLYFEFLTAVASSSVDWGRSTASHHTLLAELKEFYFATGGPNWFNNTGWIGFESNAATRVDPCNSTRPWFGLNCTAGHILTIKLDSNNLHGSLPSTFGASWELTTYLQYLSLKHNYLYGPLPPDIVTPELSELLLSDNAFNGSLPSLDGGAALTKYFLTKNNFTGQLPKMSTSSPFLSIIDVSYNSLTGDISELCNLPEGGLIELILEYNGFDGDFPTCLLENNPQISWVILKENSLSGSLTDSICLLGDALVYLDISSNNLEGTLPACLGSNTSNASSWQLNSNNLSGSLPEAICGSGNKLVRFELFGNLFTGTIPPCYGVSFPALRTLLLHDNNLHGQLPAKWNLGALNSFTASNNVLLDGMLPPPLFVSSNLRNVVVEGTQIRGSIPSTICESSSLKILALSGNNLEGDLIECIFELRGLQILRLARNSLASALPSSLGKMLDLETLDLSFNVLAGSLPASLGNLSKERMNFFDLSSNHFSCDIPPQLVAWKNLSAEHVRIFEGSNLFSCGNVQTSVFSLTIPLNSNLASVDPTASSVLCADLASRALDVFSWTSLACFFLVLFLWVVIKQKKSEVIAASTSILDEIQSTFLVQDLPNTHLPSSSLWQRNIKQAKRLIVMLASSIFASGCIALFIVWPLIDAVATSPYECPSYGKHSLAFKDALLVDFSSGIGICVGSTLFFGVIPWSVRTPESYKKDESNESTNQSQSATKFNLLACKYATLSLAKKLTIASKWAGIAAFTISPNIAYVVVLTSVKMSSSTKELAVIFIVIFKSIAASSFTPFAARSLIDDMLPIETFSSSFRFQARVAISMVISVLFGFISPVVIVLATSPSCFYHAWLHPFPQEATDIPISYCSNQALDGECTSYAVDVITSKYQPVFEYSGAECVSSIIFTYTPVYHATVLLLATVPALIDLFCIEVLAYCENKADLFYAGTARTFVFELSSIIDLTINLDSPAANKLVTIELRTRRVVEKAYNKLFFILMIAMTFGLASPSTCGICAFSAVVVMAHHVLLLKHCFDYNPELSLDDTEYCLPQISGYCLGVTVAETWMLASVAYYSFVEFTVALWGTLLLFVAMTFFYRKSGWNLSSGHCCRQSNKEMKSSTSLSSLHDLLLTDEVDLDDVDTSGIVSTNMDDGVICADGGQSILDA